MKEIAIGFWWILFCIFFSGYAIMFTITHLLSKNKKWGFVKTKVYPLLPQAYALITTCFWVFILYKANLGFVSKEVAHSMLAQFIIIWNLLALLFWIPFFRKKYYFSFIHSLLFFCLPLVFMGKNLFRFGILEREDIFNLLRIYAVGFAIYFAAISMLWIAKYFFLHLTFAKHHTI